MRITICYVFTCAHFLSEWPGFFHEYGNNLTFEQFIICLGAKDSSEKLLKTILHVVVAAANSCVHSQVRLHLFAYLK